MRAWDEECGITPERRLSLEAFDRWIALFWRSRTTYRTGEDAERLEALEARALARYERRVLVVKKQRGEGDEGKR